jgi:hypothetical protein
MRLLVVLVLVLLLVRALLLVLALDTASTPSITETRRCGKTERDGPRITIRCRGRLET